MAPGEKGRYKMENDFSKLFNYVDTRTKEEILGQTKILLHINSDHKLVMDLLTGDVKIIKIEES